MSGDSRSGRGDRGEDERDAPFAEAYADAYDALYREKDYDAEVSYLEGVFERHLAEPPERVLDLGCGTGGHAIALADRGYRVTGVDRSPAMVERAREATASAGVADAVTLRTADLVTASLDGRFDAAVAMFAVLGYVTTVDELVAALRNVAAHLEPGGVFVFDAWYGPAVLAREPEPRFAEESDGEDVVYRFARPDHDSRRQVVSVTYDLVRVDDEGRAESTTETHRVRYFFEDEVSLLARHAGLDVAAVHPFERPDDAPSRDSWNVAWVLRRPADSDARAPSPTRSVE